MSAKQHALQRRRANNRNGLWTLEEEEELLHYLREGALSIPELSTIFSSRPIAGLRAKIRKLRIKYDLFGGSYQDQKVDFTRSIGRRAKPKIVFEGYAGAGHQTRVWSSFASKVFAAEKVRLRSKQFEKTIRAEGFIQKGADSSWKVFKKAKKEIYLFVGDALDAAAEIRSNKIEIDLIDLDTCGSTLPLLPTLLVLTRPKHLVITHGEYHSMRFKREDVLRRLFTHRDITETPLPLTVADMAIELDRAAKAAALRAHNETIDSYWLDLKDEKWLGSRSVGMLRRYYQVRKPPATADCLNLLSCK